MEHRRKSQFLYMTPVHLFQTPIAGSGYSVDFYKIAGNDSFERVSKDTTIEHTREEWIAPGKIAFKSGEGQIMDVLPLESSERLISVRASSSPIGPFQVNFDRETRKIFGLTPVNPMLSNLTTIFDLLADVASTDSIECLRPFVNHEQHFIRWRAIRSIYAIDQADGIELVKGALTDPHTQIRAAATATLSQLSA